MGSIRGGPHAVIRIGRGHNVLGNILAHARILGGSTHQGILGGDPHLKNDGDRPGHQGLYIGDTYMHICDRGHTPAYVGHTYWIPELGGWCRHHSPHPTVSCRSQQSFLYPFPHPSRKGPVGALFKICSKLPLELDTPLAFCFAIWEEGGGGAEGTGGLGLAHLVTHLGRGRDSTVLNVPLDQTLHRYHFDPQSKTFYNPM